MVLRLRPQVRLCGTNTTLKFGLIFMCERKLVFDAFWWLYCCLQIRFASRPKFTVICSLTDSWQERFALFEMP